MVVGSYGRAANVIRPSLRSVYENGKRKLSLSGESFDAASSSVYIDEGAHPISDRRNSVVEKFSAFKYKLMETLGKPLSNDETSDDKWLLNVQLSASKRISSFDALKKTDLELSVNKYREQLDNSQKTIDVLIQEVRSIFEANQRFPLNLLNRSTMPRISKLQDGRANWHPSVRRRIGQSGSSEKNI